MPYSTQLIIAIALVVMNISTFTIYAVDKLLAKKSRKRIPEKVLLLLAFAFGSVGAMTSMLLFRHKTNDRDDKTKLAFTVGVPLSLICQIAICVLWPTYHGRWEYMAGVVFYSVVFGAWGVFWTSSKARKRNG